MTGETIRRRPRNRRGGGRAVCGGFRVFRCGGFKQEEDSPGLAEDPSREGVAAVAAPGDVRVTRGRQGCCCNAGSVWGGDHKTTKEEASKAIDGGHEDGA